MNSKVVVTSGTPSRSTSTWFGRVKVRVCVYPSLSGVRVVPEIPPVAWIHDQDKREWHYEGPDSAVLPLPCNTVPLATHQNPPPATAGSSNAIHYFHLICQVALPLTVHKYPVRGRGSRPPQEGLPALPGDSPRTFYTSERPPL